jgi:hypothetical protein
MCTFFMLNNHKKEYVSYIMIQYQYMSHEEVTYDRHTHTLKF